jgi:type 1 glutamine amidotransferase
MLNESKKGAFAVDFSDDYSALDINNLVKYDALVLNNTTQLKTRENPKVAPSICSFVRWGGGLCVIHAGADNFYNAPECAHLVGGRFDGHPWGAKGTWAFKVEDVDSPLTAPFKRFPNGRFKRSDEIYQQSSPFYDRSKLRVLISLDLDDSVTAGRKGMKREDGDYAVSWIRSYGNGRVFYTSFAHDRRAWEADDTRAHIFAGLAYAMGTLKADDRPVASGVKPAEEPSLGELAAMVLDVKTVGSDWRRRQACEFRLGEALADRMGDKEAVAIARRVFADRDLTEMLRAVAARVILAADSSALPDILNDSSEKVRQAPFGYGLSVPSEAFVKIVDKCSVEHKCAILAKFKRDNAKNCVKKVVELTADSDERVAVAACATLGVLGSAADVDTLNALRTRGGAVGKAAEAALEVLPGAGERIFDLAQTDKTILSVAGKRAELKLLPRWNAFISSSAADVRKAAWRAFRNMASPATEKAVRDWFVAVGSEEVDIAGNIFWQNTVKALDGQCRETAILDIWRNGTEAARLKAQEFLFREKGIDALETWEKLSSDATFGTAAKKAYCAVAADILKSGTAATALSRNGWKVSASCHVGKDKPDRAVDGDVKTRWAAGFRAKGAWFALDLGKSVFVDEVTLDTEKSPLDTPAGCNVYVSSNGVDWQGPVATCDEKTKNATTFKIGRAARHLKFEQTGFRESKFWSIHEISVTASLDPEQIKRIGKMAEAFGIKEMK